MFVSEKCSRHFCLHRETTNQQMNTQATGPQGTDNNTSNKENVEFIFLAKIDNARVISSILQTLNTKKDQVRIIINILMIFSNYIGILAGHCNNFKTRHKIYHRDRAIVARFRSSATRIIPRI